MAEPDSFSAFKELLAADLGVAQSAITDAAASAVIDEPLLLHHVAICKSDEFMRSIVLTEIANRATKYDALPSITLLRNAAAAAIKWLAAGAKFATPDHFAARLLACESCEHRKPAPSSKLYALLKTAFICDLCGCDITKKAKLGTETCPDTTQGGHGRWP